MWRITTVPGPSGAIWSAPLSRRNSPSPRTRASRLSGRGSVARSRPALSLLRNLILGHAVAPRFVLQRADFRRNVLALFFQPDQLIVPVVNLRAAHVARGIHRVAI